MTSSILSTVLYGVAYRGSVLGPILFVLYTTALLQLVRDDGLLPHAYADVTQILGIGHPLEADRLQNDVSACLDAVSSWMAANWLQLNQETRTLTRWSFGDRTFAAAGP